MRIVSGYLKGRVFNPPKNFNARPTTDFAKENLFNILNNYLEWEEIEALDIFAGTGSISYELVSRGCENVTCIEKDIKHAEFIRKVKNEFVLDNLTVITSDFYKFIQHVSKQYDLIFVDPPYDILDFEKIPELILQSNCLKQGGLLVLEHSANYDFSSISLFQEKKTYGSVNFSLFYEQQL